MKQRLVSIRKVLVLYWYRYYTRYYTRSTGTQLPRIKVLSSSLMILHYPSFEYNTATYETAVFALFLLEVSSHLIQRDIIAHDTVQSQNMQCTASALDFPRYFRGVCTTRAPGTRNVGGGVRSMNRNETADDTEVLIRSPAAKST